MKVQEIDTARGRRWILLDNKYIPKAASNRTRDIAQKLAELNPIIGVRHPEKWYAAKLKDFLFAAFAGLTATRPWDGRKRLSGGYIDVGADGNLLYYRAVSDDVFNTYLFEHTVIDCPSRGAGKDIARLNARAALEGRTVTPEERAAAEAKGKRGDWGYVFKNGEDYFININFQVRFR